MYQVLRVMDVCFVLGTYYFVLLCLGVTQNPKYRPKRSRICASRPGMELKTTIMRGTRTHWSMSWTLRKRPYSRGRAGISCIASAAESISPNIAAARNDFGGARDAA